MIVRPVPEGARLLRIEQVASQLQIAISHAYALLDRPDGIPSIRVGRRSRRVLVEEMDAYIARQQAGQNGSERQARP